MYENLQILAGATADLARHCAFLLEETLTTFPLQNHEKEFLEKFWTDENDITFEPWETMIDSEVPDPPLDQL